MKLDISRRSFDSTDRYSGVRFLQGRALVDADLNEQAEIADYRNRRAHEDLIGDSGVPVDGSNDGAFGLSLSGTNLTIAAGRMYVGGLLVENPTSVTLATQPDGADPGGRSASTLYGVYVEVFEREIVSAETDAFVDPALANTEPSARLKAVWQVKCAALTTTTSITRETVESDLETLFDAAESNVAMLATMEVSGSTTFSSSGAYRRPENQLYRIEVHDNPSSGVWRLKWSRENGTTLLPLVDWDWATTTLTCTPETLGPDSDRALAAGDIVEFLTSDDLKSTTRAGAVGILGKVDSVTDAEVTITFEAEGAAASTSLSGWLRKWDGGGSWDSVSDDWPWEADTASTAFVVIEEGIRLQFAYPTSPTVAVMQPGDYWLVPARTATNSVIGDGVSRLPDGPSRRWAVLGYGQYDSFGTGWASVTDLRRTFRPSSAVVFDKVAGDGQIALPGHWTLKQLVVDVGSKGEAVTFDAGSDGYVDSGTTRPTTNGTSTSLTVDSDSSGLAAVWWQFPATPERTTRQRFVTATCRGATRTFVGSMPSDYDIWVTKFEVNITGSWTAFPITSLANEPAVPVPPAELRGFRITLRHFGYGMGADSLSWSLSAPAWASARVRRERPGQDVLTLGIANASVSETGTETDRQVVATIEIQNVHYLDIGRYVVELHPRRTLSSGAILVPGPVLSFSVFR